MLASPATLMRGICIALIFAATLPAQTPAPASTSTAGAAATVQALNAASRIVDPAARLDALEKVRADFPTFTAVDNPILATLASNFPDREPAITAVLDRIVGRIAPTTPAESRLTAILTPVNVLLEKNLLLARSEGLVAEAVAALDSAGYLARRKEAATRLNQPEPSTDFIAQNFNTAKARGVETLGRIRLARGDTAAAERTLLEATAINAAYGPAAIALVGIYGARNEHAKGEQFLKNLITGISTTRVALQIVQPAPAQAGTAGGTATTPPPAQRIISELRPAPPSAANGARIALGELYVKTKSFARADSVLKSVLQSAPTNRAALLALGKLAAAQGKSAMALEHYAQAALTGALAAEDHAAFRAVHRAVKGNDAVDAYLDHLYEEKYPNPVKPQPWKSDNHTGRVVLLEMFTGSGCPPCVASDLALDAAMLRYPGNVIAPIVYHANIPAPDPMVTTGSEGRRIYYNGNSVPRFLVDGSVIRGGGGRTGSQPKYDSYVAVIDSMLKKTPEAKIEVSATGQGDRVEVSARVSGLPAERSNLRLHIVLVEKMLKFVGENGIRFHPMVVRAAAMDGKGIPIMTEGATRYSFSLDSIKRDVAATLDAELGRRANAPGAVARQYAAQGNAFTAIDTSQLMVVAFVQSGSYTALSTTGAPVDGAGDAAAPSANGIIPALGAATKSVANILQAAQAPVKFDKR